MLLSEVSLDPEDEELSESGSVVLVEVELLSVEFEESVSVPLEEPESVPFPGSEGVVLLELSVDEELVVVEDPESLGGESV